MKQRIYVSVMSLWRGILPDMRQAENAVRIYINNFLKLDMRPKAPTKEVEEKRDKVLSWDGAILKVKDCMRLRHYSYSTEKTYIAWQERFRDYTGKESADAVSEEDVKNFMTCLAVNQHVSASTQNQSFNAILFFFRYALEREMGDMKDNVRAKRPLRLPVVFSVHEVARIISNIFSSMKKYTMIYTHVAQKKLAVVESPLDRLDLFGGSISAHF